jgi:hypothetical protein
MGNTRALSLIVLLALALAPTAARADNEAEAKAAYARGRAHFKAGKYNEAVAELKKAYALKPHPALLRYMGDTYYKMNKARLAIEHYKKYLKEAPEAPDKDKIQTKVKQLEMIVGAEGDEKSAAPAPAPAPPPPPPPEPTPPEPTQPKVDQPLGEDREVPVGLDKKRAPGVKPVEPVREEPKPRGRPLRIAGWTLLAVGVAGVTMGVVFNRLSAGKAKELEDSVRADCPVDPKTGLPAECGGNPDMDKPVVAFDRRHYDLQQAAKSHRTVSLVSFITGGVLAGTSAALLIVDAMRGGRPEKRAAGAGRVVIAPAIGGGVLGVSGEVGF